jgi:RNA polymerase subunit RPABC4/transcription elongation factor Spt4
MPISVRRRFDIGMKKCKCGHVVANNARICPQCGNRFTRPFVKVLAWFFGVIFIIFIIKSVSEANKATGNQTTVSSHQSTPTNDDSALNGKPGTRDEAALVIARCGPAYQDSLKSASVKGMTVKARGLFYLKENLLMVFTMAKPLHAEKWTFYQAFEPPDKTSIGVAAAQSRMPCLKGVIEDNE